MIELQCRTSRKASLNILQSPRTPSPNKSTGIRFHITVILRKRINQHFHNCDNFFPVLAAVARKTLRPARASQATQVQPTSGRHHHHCNRHHHHHSNHHQSTNITNIIAIIITNATITQVQPTNGNIFRVARIPINKNTATSRLVLDNEK